jgi:predicted acyltransferase
MLRLVETTQPCPGVGTRICWKLRFRDCEKPIPSYTPPNPMPSVEPQAVSAQRPSSGTAATRLMSLDALRGFDMFWIVGAEEIVHALHKASPSGVVNFLTGQLTHKDWEGVAFYDLIFPLFVFIVGASLVFSLTKAIAESGKMAAVKRIFWRSLLLYLIGVFTYGGFAEGVERIRLLGVLQRIALCYFFAGLIFCTFRLRGMIVACVALLAGYWALMTFVPVPGVGAGNFQEGANLANYVDKQFLPLRKWDGDHDPEGLLSTLPAIATCLLGVFAGLLLKSKAMDEQKKVNWLVLAGIAGLALGFLWGLQFPVIKKIWTSSYVLVAAGYSCLFLAAFHQIIEIWNCRKWAMPFVWIGMNAITIYLAHNIIDFGKLADRLVGGPIKESFGNYGQVLVTIVVLAMTFLLVRFLYRRKLFLRL